MLESPKIDYSKLNGAFDRIHDRTPAEIAKQPSAFFDIGLPAADKLRDDHFRDSLTGLLNRDGFSHALELWKTTQPNNDARIALAYIDLNNFKTVNDEFGHNIGDQVLINVADMLRESLRGIDITAGLGGDIIARWGGDEIVLGLPIRSSPEEISHEEVFAALDEKLNGSLKQAQLAMTQLGEPDHLHNLSFAIGVEIYKAHDLDFALDELLHKPDERMYEHKRKFKVA